MDLLSVDGIDYTCHGKIANIYNNYFSTVGSSVDSVFPVSKIEPINFINFIPANFMALDPVNPSEISNIIAELKITKTNHNSVPVDLFVSF